MPRFNNAPSRALVALLVIGLLLAVAPANAHQPHDAYWTVATSPNFAQDQTVLIGSDYLTITIGVFLVMKSTDGGATWKVLRDLPNFATYAINFSPNFRNDGLIYIGGLDGIYRSLDRGESWARIPNQPFSQIRYMALSPNFATDKTIMAVTQDGLLYRSRNRGVSWQQLSVSNIPGLTLTDVKISPNFAADQTVLIGSGANGIFKSTNAGDSWTPVTQGQTLSAVAALVISPTFSQDGTAFAGTASDGVYKTSDGGDSWAPSNTGLASLATTALAISTRYSTDATLWVATASAGVARSSNGGSSWGAPTIIRRPLSDQTNIHYRSLALANTATGRNLYVAMFEGVWFSGTDGAQWNYSDTIPSYLFRKMAISPTYASDQTLFASSYGGGSIWSTDGGQTWSFKNRGLNNNYPDSIGISPRYSQDGIAFHGTVPGLNRITKATTDWTVMKGPGVKSFPRGLAISPNFAADSTLYTGVDNLGTGNPETIVYQGQVYPNQGVFVSHDAGYNWAPTGLSGPRTDFVAISPNFANDQTLFASTADSGFYKTTDAGVNWSRIDVVPGENGYLHVVMSPDYANDRTVITGTQQSGIYISRDGGTTWSLLANNGVLTALDIAISPNYATDRTIFMSTLQGGLIVSRNAGATFQPSMLTDNYITTMVFSPAYAQDHTIFASSYKGLYKSVNDGASWTFLANPGRTEEERIVTIVFRGTWTLVGENGSEGADDMHMHDSSQIEEAVPPRSTMVDPDAEVTRVRTEAAQGLISTPQDAVEGDAAQASQLVGYSCKRMQTTTQPQASATLFFYGSGIRWIATTGPSWGSGYVQIDGVTQPSPVNLNAPTVNSQQTAFQQLGLPCGSHNITVIASGQSGQSNINVDAFDVVRTGCN